MLTGDPRRVPGRARRGAGVHDVHRRRARQDHGRLRRPGRAGHPGVRRRRRRGGRRLARTWSTPCSPATGAAGPARTGSPGTPGTTSPRSGEQGDGSIAPTVDDSWALWLYTSGTTGLPKAAMHRHANIRHVCETYGAQVLGITPDDTTFSVAKMFFAYGIGNTVFFPLSVGATTVLEPRRPTPDVVRERLEAGPADAVLRGAHVLRRADRERRAGRRVLVGADVRVGGGAAAGTAAAPVHRPVRGGDPRRHRLDRGAAHLPVQPARRHPAGHDRPAGPGLRRRGPRRRRAAWCPTTSRARCTCAASRSRSATGTAPTPPGRCSRASGWSPATPTSATPRATTPAWAATATCSRPAASGSRPAEVESRLLEHPAVREAAVVGVPDADGLDKPVAVVVVAPTAPARGRAGGLVPRRARALQGAPQGRVRRRPAQDRHRQAPALQGPRPGRRTTPAAEPEARGPQPTRRGGRRDRRIEVDLLIVGAGPVGLYGAYYAGVRGLSGRRGRLAVRGRRAGHRDVPREADLRRRRLPGDLRAATWSRGLVAQAAPYDPTYLLGQEAQQLRTARRRPAAVVTTERRHARSPAARVVVTGGIGTFTPRPLPAGEEFLGRGLEYFVPELPGVRRPGRRRSSAEATAPSTGR